MLGLHPHMQSLQATMNDVSYIPARSGVYSTRPRVIKCVGVL
jgi:hypothetical protein